jgi:hypothetical protein
MWTAAAGQAGATAFVASCRQPQGAGRERRARIRSARRPGAGRPCAPFSGKRRVAGSVRGLMASYAAAEAWYDAGTFCTPSKSKKNVAPWPTELSARMRPPCRWIIRCTVASPMPVPGNSSSRWRRWKAPKSLSAYRISNPPPLSRTKYSVGLPAG